MTKEEMERQIARSLAWDCLEVAVDLGLDNGTRDDYSASGDPEDGIVNLTRFAPSGPWPHEWKPDRKIRARISVEILSDEEVTR